MPPPNASSPTESAADEAPARPPPPPKALGQAIESSRGESTKRVMWVVRGFDEKAGWLEAQPTLAKTSGTWGERMATAVSHALDARRVDSQVIPKDTTPAQMQVLYDKGLQYLCEGTLSTVTTAAGNGTLRVSYRLKRRVNDDTRTVQARTIEASAPVKTLDDASMQRLVDAVAEKIADAVVADVPADLLAIRG